MKTIVVLMFMIVVNPKPSMQKYIFQCGYVNPQWWWEYPTKEVLDEVKEKCPDYDVSITSKTVALTVVDETVTDYKKFFEIKAQEVLEKMAEREEFERLLDKVQLKLQDECFHPNGYSGPVPTYCFKTVQ